ncbi:MAG: GGDEF domain-containing protein [Devosia sp.]
MRFNIDISPQSWGRVALTTIAGTIVCIIAALYVDSFNFRLLDEAALGRAILTDILLPLLLAAPLLLFFSNKLRELAIAHARLTIYASTDALTGVMNRGAFSTLVDAYLHEVRRTERQPQGALLIVDADNFKSINDSFGHDRGDEALRMIASSIKSLLRAPDLVGRLGGEEFGVFLPGSAPDQAAAVAERIRNTVFEMSFTPGGTAHRLSVSVGGAAFDRSITFQDLFRLADQQLYAAKQAGRNRALVRPVVRYEPVPAVAA